METIATKDFIIDKIRGSLFLPQIEFNWKFVSQLQVLLPEYIPSFVASDTPQVIREMFLTPGNWMLISPDKKEILAFQAQKIDYIITNVGETYSVDSVRSITDRIKRLFESIIELVDQKSSRLAIAPTFKYMWEDSNLKKFINSVYTNNSFKESCVCNCDFSQVFRVKEKINDKYYILNYLSKFYTLTSPKVDKGVRTFTEFNMLDFDINTFVKTEYSFDKLAVTDFFEKAADLCSAFMQFYFKE